VAKQPKSYEIDMLNGPLTGKLLLFALPLMLSSLLQLLFNAADVVVVGRFAGKEALAAVGSTGSLINLFVNFFIGLSIGTNVMVARDIGSGQESYISRGVHTAISLALISGAFLMAAGTLLAKYMLVLMQSPPDVIDLSALYLRIYFLGTPGTMLYNFGSAILRAQGDTRRPLYFLTAAGIINVLLNLVFVIPLQMSVAGVALATIISQYISAALVLMTLMRDKGLLHLDLRQLCLDKRAVKRILKVGVPSGLQSIMFSLSNVVVQSSINSFQSTAIVAGSATCGNIEGFIYAGIHAFQQTSLTFSSQNYGANQCKRVDKVLGLCMLYAVIYGIVVGNLAYVFGHPLASIYSPGEEEVIAEALQRMRITSTTYFLCGIMDVFSGTLRGMGYSLLPMIISLVGACGIRLLWVSFIFPIYHTPTGLFLCYPFSWALTSAAYCVFFFLIRKHAYAKAVDLQETPATS